MCLRVAHLYLQKALRHGVHLFDLIGYSKVTVRVYRLIIAHIKARILTVCSLPPTRGSSKTVLRAKGETVVMLVMVRGQDGGAVWATV